MACTVQGLLTSACTSGIGKVVDKIQLLQIIAQLKTDCINYNNRLVYTQSNGVTTIIDNPVGAYNLTAINPKIVSVYSHNAPNITSLTLTDDPLLTVISLQNCAALATLNFARCAGLTSVNLNTFTSLTTVNFEDCLELSAFSATSLVTVGAGGLNLRNLANISKMAGAFSLPVLATVGGSFFLYGTGSTSLTSVSLPSLTSVGAFFIVANHSNLTTISAPNVSSVGADFNVSGNTSLAIASFNNLGSVGSNVFVLSNSAMTQLSLSSLAAVGSIQASGCTSLSSSDLSSLSSCPGLNFNLCTALASFSLPSMVAPSVFSGNFADCSSLTSYSHGTIRFDDNDSLLWTNDALDVASVNAILVGADASGLIASNIDLSGGTNAAPTGAGIVAKANLIGAGNTVTTN